MGLADLFKNIGNGLSDEMKDFRSVLGRVRLTVDSSALGANFRKFGPSFSTYDFAEFNRKAREFYKENIDSDNPMVTVVKISGARVAIDYNSEIRGIFTAKGKPLAFFRPDYHQAGYRTRSAEMEDFKNGKNIPVI